MSGLSSFLKDPETLRWILPIAVAGLMLLSDTRYVKKEELSSALQDIATTAASTDVRLAAIEKTQAIQALQTATLQDHEERLRILEKVRR